MLLLYIVCVFCAKEATRVNENQFQEKLSIMPPHVSENGRNDVYSFDGSYVNITRSRNDYTQLGYNTKGTTGIMHLKKAIKPKNFQFEIEFELEHGNAGTNMGFWLCDKISTGLYYGRNEDYNGVGVVIDSSKKPAAKFVSSHDKVNSKVFYPRLGGRSKLIFKCHGGKLTATLIAQDVEHVLYEGVSTLEDEVVLGVSAVTGDSEVPAKVYMVAGHTIAKLSNASYVVGETRKSKKMTYFIGLCCIGGLAYYLYTKQAKDFDLKN